MSLKGTEGLATMIKVLFRGVAQEAGDPGQAFQHKPQTIIQGVALFKNELG